MELKVGSIYKGVYGNPDYLFKIVYMEPLINTTFEEDYKIYFIVPNGTQGYEYSWRLRDCSEVVENTKMLELLYF